MDRIRDDSPDEYQRDRRCMNAVREDMQMVSVTEDADDRVRSGRVICCGDP